MYYYILPGNGPKSVVLKDLGLKIADCKDKKVQVGVPCILPNGKYSKEYVWVFVLSINNLDEKGRKKEFCGETLHPMKHKAPLSKEGKFAWVRRGRVNSIPKHNDEYVPVRVQKRTVLRFRKSDIVDVKLEVA